MMKIKSTPPSAEQLKSFFGQYRCDDCGRRLVAVGLEHNNMIMACPECDLHQGCNCSRKEEEMLDDGGYNWEDDDWYD